MPRTATMIIIRLRVNRGRGSRIAGFSSHSRAVEAFGVRSVLLAPLAARFGWTGRGGRQRGIGGSGSGLPGSPVRGAIGDFGAGWFSVGFHELDSKIIEE